MLLDFYRFLGKQANIPLCCRLPFGPWFSPFVPRWSSVIFGDPQVIYSSSIKGFAQAKQAEKCFRTLEEMEAQGNGLCGGSDSFKRAERWFPLLKMVELYKYV